MPCINRRTFLARSSTGIGTLALASLLDPRLLLGGRPVDRAGPLEGGHQPASRRPEGQADHLPVHGRRAVAPGDARLQADPGEDARAADARVVHQGDADRAAPGAEADLLRPPAQVRPLRPVGRRAELGLPPPGDRRRRALHRPLDGHRGDQPRPGTYVHEHGYDDLRPAGDGVVDQLRAGVGERQPARVRGADLDGPVRPGPADRLAAVAQRVPAQPVPGRPVLLQGRSGPLPGPARRGSTRSASATWSTPCRSSTRSRTRWSTTPRSRPGSMPTRRPSGCRRACPS